MIDVTEHLGLVGWVLARLNPYPLDHDDAFQEGCLGLCQAAQRYDGRGKFSPFAIKRIKGAILDAQRAALGRDHGKPQNNAYSIDAYAIDVFAPDLDLEAVIEEAETVARLAWLRSRLAKLPERQRVALSANLAGRPFWRIAKDLGISESRACQLAKQAREALVA